MFHKKLLIASLGGLALSVAAVNANATVLGTADLEISNFALIDATTQGAPEGVFITGGTRNGTLSVQYEDENDVIFGNSGTDPIGDVDLGPICVGPDCDLHANNDSETELTPGTGNLASADLFVSGSALDGDGADGLTRADASTEETEFSAVGSSNSAIDNNVRATLDFQVDTTADLALVFDYDLFVRSYISPDLFGTTSNSNASTDFTVEVFQGNETIFEFEPSEINVATTAFAGEGENDVTLDRQGTAVSDVLTLGPGNYTLAISQKAAADVIVNPQAPPPVSEPSTIALLGLGIFSIGFVAARRRMR